MEQGRERENPVLGPCLRVDLVGEAQEARLGEYRVKGIKSMVMEDLTGR